MSAAEAVREIAETVMEEASKRPRLETGDSGDRYFEPGSTYIFNERSIGD